MLARGALSRLAAEVPKQATHDVRKLATLVHAGRSAFSLPVRTLAHVSQLQTRSYATTKAEKDPAALVKKAVKAKAAAGKKVTKTATRKTATKKTATKKAATKKAAPKKARKTAAPKKPVKKPKKVLTDEEKQKADIRRLRQIALKEPVSRVKMSALNVFIAERTKELKDTKEAGRTALAVVAASFKDISPAEREKWNHLAAERTETRLAEYQVWVKSHTPDQIRLANNARAQLRRKLAGTFKGPISHTRAIEDDRQAKRPVSAWGFFFAERQSSSDFTGISVAERAKLIGSEWKELSASEKQRFEDQAAADKERYTREMAALNKA